MTDAPREDRNPLLIGMFAGALAAAMDEFITHLPGYYDVILRRYDVSVFATVMTMLGPVWIMAYRNQRAPAARIAWGAILVSMGVFSLRMLVFRWAAFADKRWIIVVAIIAHAVLGIPTAFAAAYLGRRAKSRMPDTRPPTPDP